MGPTAEIKKRVLKSLPEAYGRLTMSGLGKWVENFHDAEREYALCVVAYLGKQNGDASKRVWGVDSGLIERILKEV